MFSGERAGSENLNLEDSGINPESANPNPEATPESAPERTREGALLDSAITPSETKAKKDPIISSKWGEKFKDFYSPKENWKATKEMGKVAGITAGVVVAGLFLWIIKDIYIIWKLGVELVKNNGKIGYGTGKKIMEDAFSHLGVGEQKKS